MQSKTIKYFNDYLKESIDYKQLLMISRVPFLWQNVKIEETLYFGAWVSNFKTRKHCIDLYCLFSYF